MYVCSIMDQLIINRMGRKVKLDRSEHRDFLLCGRNGVPLSCSVNAMNYANDF